MPMQQPKNLVANRANPWGAFMSNLKPEAAKSKKESRDSKINDFIVRNSVAVESAPAISTSTSSRLARSKATD